MSNATATLDRHTVTLSKECAIGNGNRPAGFLLGYFDEMIVDPEHLAHLIQAAAWSLDFPLVIDGGADGTPNVHAITCAEPTKMTSRGDALVFEPGAVLGAFIPAEGVTACELVNALRSPGLAKIKLEVAEAPTATEPADGDDGATVGDYEALSVKDLKNLARGRVRGFSSMNRDALIDALAYADYCDAEEAGAQAEALKAVQAAEAADAEEVDADDADDREGTAGDDVQLDDDTDSE